MATKIPSLNWLRVFEAAARCESFSRAAGQLNMSPAAVSQQVKALEERLGAPLFERHAHAVTLTETGRAYLPSVQQALLTLEGATDGLFGAGPAQQLFVQSVLIFAHGVLARGLTNFAGLHPDISLTLTTANQPHEFAQGFNDMQIVFGNPQAHGPESDRLMGEKLYPVALPEVAQGVSSPQDLLQHRLIEVATHRAGWPYLFDHLGVLPGTARYVYADSTLMAMAMASEGGGVALARAPASDKAMAEAGLVPCLDFVSVEGRETYHLVYPDRRALRPPARSFRDWMLDWTKGLDD
ncbi:Glycine cleavage system transcriptional activator [Roseovarius litorisediminis]|uniref:Glycine cleavage system transcriptional activator n=1 Tax=Roseovarius litorisediminis TaxID=1312363 RepID=A0A1Y5SF59_9RHOB|nr:LysR family transcriptional regulator [Roseovarius litorisediminis]SLN38600.1 Glycine cleavage system transcriptional activator [Roseovarius litorisediminis]